VSRQSARLDADQPDTISVCVIADESFAVIAKLEADGVGIEREPRLKLGCARVPQRIG
jgi:hypothetical protein